jgi:hypothetical protein
VTELFLEVSIRGKYEEKIFSANFPSALQVVLPPSQRHIGQDLEDMNTKQSL